MKVSPSNAEGGEKESQPVELVSAPSAQKVLKQSIEI
jgi:hypothetical protein